MEPSSIRMVCEQRNGLIFAEANAFAKKSGSRLARNHEFDAFFSSHQESALTLSSNAWTETIVAYPRPKKPFDEALEWTDPRTKVHYRLDTQNFKGQKNIALSFEGCEIVEDGQALLYQPKSDIVVIEKFPQESGFYARHEQTGIPFDDGQERRPGYPGTAHLSRDNNDCWVGPIVRSYSRIHIPDNLDHDIYMIFRPSSVFGIFIAEPKS